MRNECMVYELDICRIMSAKFIFLWVAGELYYDRQNVIDARGLGGDAIAIHVDTRAEYTNGGQSGIEYGRGWRNEESNRRARIDTGKTYRPRLDSNE